MMKSELLPFKYKGVPRIDEIQKDPVGYGWKCRKYIRWVLVHETRADRNALKVVGDELVDNNRLNQDLYLEICPVFLNVQKWRLDKENLSVEPERRANWEELRIVIEAANDSPALMVNDVQQRNISHENCNVVEIQEAFWMVKIVEFFNEISLGSFSDIILHDTEVETLRYSFNKSLKDFFSSYVASFPYPGSTSQAIESLFEFMGLDGLTFYEGLNCATEKLDTAKRKIFIEYCKLSRDEFLQIGFSKNDLLLKINSNHPFCGLFSENKEQKHLFEKFLKSYALSYDDLISDGSTLDRFTKYLGLNLLREM